ncbi:MAG: hypothetical protein FWH35_04305 [Treponema sp.]|nr:hypothetical protein [Treponema sp.]
MKILKAENGYKGKLRFIILIPHRDEGNRLNQYREKLFSLGLYGAFSFPAAAPLAMASRPFSREELKELAKNIRKITMENGGKIESGELSTTEAGNKLEKMHFFGPLLKLPFNEGLFPAGARKKIIRSYLPPILCAALIKPPQSGEKSPAPPVFNAPAFSFRAASLANLVISPLSGGDNDFSFEWETGAPVWLPAWRSIC